MTFRVIIVSSAEKHPMFRTWVENDRRYFAFGSLPVWHNESGGGLVAHVNETDPVPTELSEFITSVTCDEYVPAYSRRERGYYTYKTASAEVEFQRITRRNRRYRVDITAKNIKDAQELLRAFKAGTLLPTTSYEGVQ